MAHLARATLPGHRSARCSGKARVHGTVAIRLGAAPWPPAISPKLRQLPIRSSARRSASFLHRHYPVSQHVCAPQAITAAMGWLADSLLPDRVRPTQTLSAKHFRPLIFSAKRNGLEALLP